MARIATRMGLVFLLATACITISAQLSAGQAAPAPAADCTNEILQLFPCLDFLSNSSVTTVVPSCCSALSNVSISSPFCLCEIISPAFANQTATLGVNETRALQLPGLCSLNVGPSNCAAILGPSAAPAPLSTVLAPAPAPVRKFPSLAPSPLAALTPAPVASAPVETPESSAAPGPAVDCNSEITTLSGCLTFLTGTATAPSDTCCINLDSVVSTAPECLCSLATSPAVSTVDPKLIQELADFCKVSASFSDCAGALPPAALPNGSEAPGGSPANHCTKFAPSSSMYMLIALGVVAFGHTLPQ